jgi:catechol 2,3-dioxygenase-like lactoylglutathione lyase family enzyme
VLFDHVHLRVRDRETSMRFYRAALEALGWPRERERVLGGGALRHDDGEPTGWWVRESSNASRLALTPAEAAATLGCSRDFFDLHIGPQLRWIRRGRLKLVAIVELEDWLGRNAALTLER